MANEWVSPTGHNDPDDVWQYEQNAYDGDLNSLASCYVPPYYWTRFLELTIEAVYCSKVRFMAEYKAGGINKIDLDIYYDDSWHDVYEGSFIGGTHTEGVWVEKSLEETYYVSKMRIRFYNKKSFAQTARLVEVMFYEVASIPIVTTNAATDVEDDEATLNGNITDDGGDVPTIRGFKYKEGVGGGEVDASENGAFETGTFSEDLTGLDDTKKYYFRAYATNSEGTGYGEWLSFGVDVDPPTVTSGAATSVDHESAVANGNITATGGQDCTERGFQYGLTETGTWTVRETGTFGVGAFSLDLEELSANTKYYFRAYAINGAGTSYGSWLNFTTSYTTPEVITHNATDELEEQVTGNGEIVKTGGQDCDERGFEYGLTKTATWLKNEVAGSYGVGHFSLDITGLTANTEYWYRAYAKFYLRPIDISSLTYDEKSYDADTQINQASYVSFSPDGSKMYLADVVDGIVYQYTLSTPWDISTATYDDKYYTAAQMSYIKGCFFKPDGSKMYLTSDGDDRVYQYTLSTAWDVSTATYDSKFYQESIAGETHPYGLFFNPDGSKMYVGGKDTKKVYQFTLSTEWDVSTAAYNSKFYYFNLSNLNDISLILNGKNLCIFIGNVVHQYTLSTAWDITTASYDSKSKDVVAQENSCSGLFLKPYGDKLFIIGSQNFTVYQYSVDLLVYTGYGEWVKFITAAPGLPGDTPSGYRNDVCSDQSGYSYILNRSLTDDGATYESFFILSTDLSGKKTLHTHKRLLDIFSYFANKGTGTAKIYVKRDTEPSWQYAGEISLTGEDEIIIKHLPSDNEDTEGDVDFLAKTFLIKFVFENDFEFVGVITEAVPIGDR